MVGLIVRSSTGHPTAEQAIGKAVLTCDQRRKNFRQCTSTNSHTAQRSRLTTASNEAIRSVDRVSLTVCAASRWSVALMRDRVTASTEEYLATSATLRDKSEWKSFVLVFMSSFQLYV